MTTILVKDKNNNILYSVDVSDDPPSAEYSLQAERMKKCAEHQNFFNPSDPYFVVDSAGRTLFAKVCAECGGGLPVT